MDHCLRPMNSLESGNSGGLPTIHHQHVASNEVRGVGGQENYCPFEVMVAAEAV
jgi:hypothetical protein